MARKKKKRKTVAEGAPQQERDDLIPGSPGIADRGRLYFEIRNSGSDLGRLVRPKRGGAYKFKFVPRGEVPDGNIDRVAHLLAERHKGSFRFDPSGDRAVMATPEWEGGDMDSPKVQARVARQFAAADIVFHWPYSLAKDEGYIVTPPAFSELFLEALGKLVPHPRREIFLHASHRKNFALMKGLETFYLVDLEQTDLFSTDPATGRSQLCYQGEEHVFLPSPDRGYFPYKPRVNGYEDDPDKRYDDPLQNPFDLTQPAVLLSLQAMEALRAAGRHGAFDYEVKPRFPYIYGEDALQMIEDIKDFPPFDPLMPDSEWPGPLVEYALGHGYRT